MDKIRLTYLLSAHKNPEQIPNLPGFREVSLASDLFFQTIIINLTHKNLVKDELMYINLAVHLSFRIIR